MTEGRHIELDVADLNRNKTSLRRYAAVLGLVFIVLLGVVGMFALARSIPYEPLVVYDYQVDKLEYCPFEQVEVSQELEVKDKWYYTVGNLEAELYMSKGGRPYLSSTVDVDIGAMPRAIYPSNGIRVAPPIPGEWVAEGRGTLYGKMFGFVPVEQDIAVVTTPPYEVKSWDAAECDAASRGE